MAKLNRALLSLFSDIDMTFGSENPVDPTKTDTMPGARPSPVAKNKRRSNEYVKLINQQAAEDIDDVPFYHHLLTPETFTPHRPVRNAEPPLKSIMKKTSGEGWTKVDLTRSIKFDKEIRVVEIPQKGKSHNTTAAHERQKLQAKRTRTRSIMGNPDMSRLPIDVPEDDSMWDVLKISTAIHRMHKCERWMKEDRVPPVLTKDELESEAAREAHLQSCAELEKPAQVDCGSEDLVWEDCVETVSDDSMDEAMSTSISDILANEAEVSEAEPAYASDGVPSDTQGSEQRTTDVEEPPALDNTKSESKAPGFVGRTSRKRQQEDYIEDDDIWSAGKIERLMARRALRESQEA